MPRALELLGTRIIAPFYGVSLYVWRDFADFIFLAANEPIDLSAPGLLPEQIRWLEERQVAVPSSPGPVLTDDFNPLVYLQTAKAEHYRQFLVGGTRLFVP